MTEIKRKVLIIRELIEMGYKDKHICMVVQAKQPYVSKIRHGRIHAKTSAEEEKVVWNEGELRRKALLDVLLAAPELYTSGMTNQDLYYIHLLKFLMVDKEVIYSLYFHLTKTAFNKLWTAKDVDIVLFNSEVLNIPYKDFLDLIIDFFRKE